MKCFSEVDTMRSVMFAPRPGSSAGAVVSTPREMAPQGAGVFESTEREPCHLSLIIVVNTAILGLVASFALAAVEITAHVLT